MITMRALTALDEDARVRALRVTTIRVPADEVLQNGWSSVGRKLDHGRPPHAYLGRRHRRVTSLVTPCVHAIRTAEGVRRFTGFLAARSAVDLVDYLEDRYVPLPDTMLGQYIGMRATTRAMWLSVVERALALVAGSAEGDGGPSLRGIYILPDTGLDHLGQVRVGGRTCWVGISLPPRIVVRRRVRFGEADVPIEAWVTTMGRREPYAWWDGHRFGVTESLTGLPRSLRERLSHGVSRERDVLGLPLTDVRPLALVRVPRREELVEAVAPPRAGLGAGVLVPSTATVPLFDADGAPLPIPVIDRPAEALAILTRTAGAGFVPWAEPQISTDDAWRLFRDHRWWVLGSPRGAR